MAMRTRKCQRCERNRQLKFYTPKGRICSDCRKRTRSSATKDVRLQTTYGITLEEWHALLSSQGGACAICQGKRSGYDVDHDHKAEKLLIESGVGALSAARMSVRGLLCKRCNRRMLPSATDRPELLRRGADYLENPPAHEVLHGVLDG